MCCTRTVEYSGRTAQKLADIHRMVEVIHDDDDADDDDQCGQYPVKR